MKVTAVRHDENPPSPAKLAAKLGRVGCVQGERGQILAADAASSARPRSQDVGPSGARVANQM